MSTSVELRPQLVRNEFQSAVRLPNLDTPLNQLDVKSAVVVTMDRIVGLVYQRQVPLPRLFANRVFFEDKGDILQFTNPVPNESILDVAVYRGETDPYETLATAESEAWAHHEATSTSSSETSNYLWDLYKLLQVYSPLRLFVARVRGCEHCTILESRIEALVSAYKGCLRSRDMIFSIVLPTTREAFANLTCFGWRATNDGLEKL